MDDKTKTGSPDSKFINVNEDYEVAYWTKDRNAGCQLPFSFGSKLRSAIILTPKLLCCQKLQSTLIYSDQGALPCH